MMQVFKRGTANGVSFIRYFAGDLTQLLHLAFLHCSYHFLDGISQVVFIARPEQITTGYFAQYLRWAGVIGSNNRQTGR
jgi:hypothetical protein